MNLMELVIAGIMFVVLGFVLTIGQNITAQNAANICSQVNGHNWGVFNVNLTGTNFPNPVDNSWQGCCTTVNATNSSICRVWDTGSYAINSTYYAMNANNTLSYWLPIIALAMAAGFVIAILITYLLGSVVGRHQAATI